MYFPDGITLRGAEDECFFSDRKTNNKKAKQTNRTTSLSAPEGTDSYVANIRSYFHTPWQGLLSFQTNIGLPGYAGNKAF